MGVSPALARAFALDDSYGWAFSLEFSLASIFSFASGDLCRGSSACEAGITDPGYSGAHSHCRYSHRHANAAYDCLARLSPQMGPSWACLGIVCLRAASAPF